MIETHEKMIDDFNVMVTEMPAMRALRIQTKLLKIIGSPLSELLKIKPDDEDSENNCFSKSVTILCQNLNENDFENLVLELCLCVRVNGHEMKKSFIDITFTAKLNTLFKILAYVIEVNYADFFQEGSFINQAIAELKTRNTSKSKTESKKISQQN